MILINTCVFNKELEDVKPILIKDIVKHLKMLIFFMNNLYGCAMSQCLPINNFKWVKDIKSNKR